MKVTDIRTVMATVPLESPVRTAIHNIEQIHNVLVFVDTDDGVTGESYLFGFAPHRMKTLDEMVLSLKAEVVGEDIRYSEGIWHKMWGALNFFGHKGISVFGMSAVDMAIWDAKGKATGQSVSHMVGACRDIVPV